MRVPVAFMGQRDAGPAWASRYRCEWGEVVGRRIRTLRQRGELRIVDLANEIGRADGKPYSPAFVSRLERGWASAPLYTYISIARRFGVPPGKLLGEDGLEGPASEAELTLIRVIRQLDLTPEDVLAELTQARWTPMSNSRPSMSARAPFSAPERSSDVASVSPET